MQQPGGSPPPQPGDKRRISSICCDVAPPVLEFDMAGNLVSSWGGPGPGYQWPASMHGITVDGKDNVWLPTNQGHQMLKFTRQGKFLLQIGHEGQSKGNTDTANLNRAGRSGSRSRRERGVRGRRLRQPPRDRVRRRHGRIQAALGRVRQEAGRRRSGPVRPGGAAPSGVPTVHCAQIANDGLVYVCDRANDRIQVFRKDGTFVKEAQIAKDTLGDGVVFDIAFSRDTPQRHAFVADGANHRVWTMLREPLQVVSHFGSGGRYPGQFYAVHNVSLDSKGNIYTVETYEGKRLQKFNYKGIGAVTATTN